MIKFFILLLSLTISLPAQAQFAAGYAPRYDYEETETDEEETSSVFKTRSAPAETPA